MNRLIKSVLEILGDHQKDGGYKFYNIPIFLNKDETTQYPEIRVSPYIQNDNVYDLRWTNKTLNSYRTYKAAKFQIDIYSKNLAEANRIHSALESRIYDFSHLEVLTYNYNEYFEEQDGYYKNISYGIGELFKDIHSIYIRKHKIHRVLKLEQLHDDSFYVDNEALYIKTKRNLKFIQIKVILQGKLFNNKDDLASRNIILIEKNESRNLSELEDNEVERVSFDLDILFTKTVKRDNIRPVDFVEYKSKNK